MGNQKYEVGMNIRRSVLGEEYVARAEARKSDFDAGFQQFITEVAWGTVWAQPELPRKTRHMLTIALLAALGREHELAAHLRATANTGVTAEEIAELFHMVAIYAGVPAANAAFALAREVGPWVDREDET